MFKIRHRKTSDIAILVLILSIAMSSLAFGQIPWPEKGKNLKVLPKDISKAELRKIMFQFCNALNFNCVDCHVAKDRNDWGTYDFASDGKETKNVARTMLKMVHMLNDETLPGTGRPAAKIRKIQCATCHHGVSKPPLPLEEEIMAVIEQDGVEGGIAHYHQLRERYAGKTAYDFTENSLNALGYNLISLEKINDAIAIFKLNVEMFPDAANPYDSLAEAYMMNGKNWLAIVNYSKSLQLNPENDNAEKMLNQLTNNAFNNAGGGGVPGASEEH